MNTSFQTQAPQSLRPQSFRTRADGQQKLDEKEKSRDELRAASGCPLHKDELLRDAQRNHFPTITEQQSPVEHRAFRRNFMEEWPDADWIACNQTKVCWYDVGANLSLQHDEGLLNYLKKSSNSV